LVTFAVSTHLNANILPSVQVSPHTLKGPKKKEKKQRKKKEKKKREKGKVSMNNIKEF